jgi:modification methylase
MWADEQGLTNGADEQGLTHALPKGVPMRAAVQEEGGRAVIYRGDARRMSEIADACARLVVTSPPYWQIKDYGVSGQIGSGESLHQYLLSLASVWAECLRALGPGGRMCVNIGDQFARASLYGRYRVVPLHAEVICQSCAIGFDYLGSIIWQKKTTMNPSGGAVVMGSFPYPPNGIVELDCEYIHVFRVPGAGPKPSAEAKRASALTTAEWKEYFAGHWRVAGARKRGHEAPFPEEIPRRLIRMFSLVGDTVLDPFMGSGTTARAAVALGRSAVGYEIDARCVREAVRSLGPGGAEARTARRLPPAPVPERARPRIPEMQAAAPGRGRDARGPQVHKVTGVRPDCSLELEGGTRVRLAGIRITDTRGALEYLERRILRRQVILRDPARQGARLLEARVSLKNRISVDGSLVKAGFAEPAEGKDQPGAKS